MVKNASRFDSGLNKKLYKLAYNAVIWAVAADIVYVKWLRSGMNIVDKIAKQLTLARKKSFLDHGPIDTNISLHIMI